MAKWRMQKMKRGHYRVINDSLSFDESHYVELREDAIKLKKELNDVPQEESE